MHLCRRIVLLAAAAAAVAVSVACAKAPSRAYHDANMDFGSVQSVAVLPFANLSRDQGAGERVRDVFSTSLLASGSVYVVPAGEVARAVQTTGVANPSAPTIDDVVRLGKLLKVDAVVTGTVKEYGEVRSGTASANAVALSAQMQEVGTGKVVWAASTTRGGIGASERMLGGGGRPLNDVTQEAVDDLLDKLFR
jgi:hypothetical protein